MLNERLADLLDRSIEEYIKTAVPIASGTMSARVQRARSPATIRNDLKILEELGFLRQVHASSGGRIPTARAYMEYIENASDDPTFVAELINDLQQLNKLVARIERKLAGSMDFPMICATQEDLIRKINFQKMFEDPELQMSAIYLIIKEKIDNGKM